MPTAKAIAILRDGVFSPNHIANDAAILHAAAQELRKRGILVDVCSEKEFCENDVTPDIILSMARSQATLDKMKRLEDEGIITLNSGYGIENCVRMVRIPLMKEAGVPVPETYVVDTNIRIQTKLKKAGFGHCWVKRADSRTRHLEDSARCRHPEEAQELLHEFFFRGIHKAAVSRHVDGDILKFYGVASAGWFHWFMPLYPADSDRAHPLMSEEFITNVRGICENAAASIGIDVYGGELVITPCGECLVVDIDDWPSFGPCRQDAAKAIAKAVMARVNPKISKRRRS